MNRPRSKKSRLGDVCAELHADDCVDPRRAIARESRNVAQIDRKTLQLCKQVERAVQFALASECDDPLLSELDVVSVTPCQNSGTLDVRLRVIVGGNTYKREEIEAALAVARGRIRSIVAGEVTRRKAPELRFIVIDRQCENEEGSR